MKDLTTDPKGMQQDVAKFYDLGPGKAKDVELNKMIVTKGGKPEETKPATQRP